MPDVADTFSFTGEPDLGEALGSQFTVTSVDDK